MSFTLSSWLNKLVKKNIFSKLFIENIQTRCVIDKCIFIYLFHLSCTNARLKTQELINLMHALIRLFVVSQNPELSFHWLEQNQEPGPSHIKKKPWKKRCSLNGKISVVFQNNICTFIPEIPHKQELPPTAAIALHCILRCSQILIIKLTLSDPLKPRQQKTEIVAKIIVALKWIRNLRRNTKWFWPFQTELKNPIKKVDSLIS